MDLTSGPSRLHDHVHAYSPAIPASGLFWTVPLASARFHVEVDGASAVMRVQELEVPDWGNLKEATTNGPHVPANVSFDVRWQGILDTAEKRQDEERWMGECMQTTATSEWSARQEGFSCISAVRASTFSVAGVLGRERHGAFFA